MHMSGGFFYYHYHQTPLIPYIFSFSLILLHALLVFFPCRKIQVKHLLKVPLWESQRRHFGYQLLEPRDLIL